MENNKGRVYLASTESELKNGWLKCGMTTRDSKIRISEGNVASVREKYEMQYTVDTVYYLELEKHMHSSYENQKEWIKVSLAEAIAEINRFIKSKSNKTKSKKYFTPKSHQLNAIDAVFKESKVNDRASIVMPTGSGKTLTSLWITEKLNSQVVLFLAPSLQLIRQTKDAWEDQAKIDFLWMACCSATEIEDRDHAVEMGGGMTFKLGDKSFTFSVK